MKREKDFRDRLEPFTKLYKNMFDEIRAKLESMTEEEFNQIMQDTREPSQTNCGWTTFEAAAIVNKVGRYVGIHEYKPQAIKATESPSVVDTTAEGELN